MHLKCVDVCDHHPHKWVSIMIFNVMADVQTTQVFSLFLSLSLNFSFSVSLSLSHTHTQTQTHTHSVVNRCNAITFKQEWWLLYIKVTGRSNYSNFSILDSPVPLGSDDIHLIPLPHLPPPPPSLHTYFPWLFLVHWDFNLSSWHSSTLLPLDCSGDLL